MNPMASILSVITSPFVHSWWQELAGLEHRARLGSGEFGSKLETNGDKAWLHDLSQWVNNIGPARDGLHTDVTSFFYWCAPLTALLFLPSPHIDMAAACSSFPNWPSPECCKVRLLARRADGSLEGCTLDRNKWGMPCCLHSAVVCAGAGTPTQETQAAWWMMAGWLLSGPR